MARPPQLGFTSLVQATEANYGSFGNTHALHFSRSVRHKVYDAIVESIYRDVDKHVATLDGNHHTEGEKAIHLLVKLVGGKSSTKKDAMKAIKDVKHKVLKHAILPACAYIHYEIIGMARFTIRRPINPTQGFSNHCCSKGYH
jgi:hypothetical protein